MPTPDLVDTVLASAKEAAVPITEDTLATAIGTPPVTPDLDKDITELEGFDALPDATQLSLKERERLRKEVNQVNQRLAEMLASDVIDDPQEAEVKEAEAEYKKNPTDENKAKYKQELRELHDKLAQQDKELTTLRETNAGYEKELKTFQDAEIARMIEELKVDMEGQFPGLSKMDGAVEEVAQLYGSAPDDADDTVSRNIAIGTVAKKRGVKPASPPTPAPAPAPAPGAPAMAAPSREPYGGNKPPLAKRTRGIFS